MAALVSAGLALSGCGSADPQPTLGSLVSATSVSASPSARVTPSASAPSSSQSSSSKVGALKGGGPFVYASGQVTALLQLPADGTQEDVVAFKDFLTRAHGLPVKVVSITVVNESQKPFSINGFHVSGTGGNIALRPAATYVNLAMALPGVTMKPELVSSGTAVSLTSATVIPPGKQLTTLVATDRDIGTVSRITYSNGSSTVTLKPLWQVTRSNAVLPQALADAAKQLARKQAEAAQKRARDGRG